MYIFICHTYADLENIKKFLLIVLDWLITLPVILSLSPCMLAFSHLFCRVDVHPLVKLFLKQRDHGVIPRNSVDPGVFQAHLLHQTAAELNDHWDELRRKVQSKQNVVLDMKNKLHLETESTVAHLVVYTRLTFLQPHTKSFGPSFL